MFEKLKPYYKFKKIVVIGPQRSGTRIAARMLEEDLGLEFYPAEEIESVSGLFDSLSLSVYGDGVYHAPHITWCAHAFCEFQDVLWVWMLRPAAQVLRSMARVGWGGEALERALLPPGYQEINPLPLARWTYWKRYQKTLLPNTVELRYKSLREHPLWVERSERAVTNDGAGFRAHQTAVEDVSDLAYLDDGVVECEDEGEGGNDEHRGDAPGTE